MHQHPTNPWDQTQTVNFAAVQINGCSDGGQTVPTPQMTEGHYCNRCPQAAKVENCCSLLISRQLRLPTCGSTRQPAEPRIRQHRARKEQVMPS